MFWLILARSWQNLVKILLETHNISIKRNPGKILVRFYKMYPRSWQDLTRSYKILHDLAGSCKILARFSTWATKRLILWDEKISTAASDKLQKLQNRTARVITRTSYDTNSSLLFDMLGWGNLSPNRKKQKAIIMYKTIDKLTPVYLQEIFTTRNTNYDLRDAENKLYVPKPRTDYLKRSFCYSGAFLWNNLPHNIRMSNSLRGIDKLYSLSDSHTANM